MHWIVDVSVLIRLSTFAKPKLTTSNKVNVIYDADMIYNEYLHYNKILVVLIKHVSLRVRMKLVITLLINIHQMIRNSFY